MKYLFLLRKTIPFFIIMLLLFSCKPREEIVYYQNIDGLVSKEKSNSYEIKIQPDDLLMIVVSADDPETAMPFNLRTISIASTNSVSASGQEMIQSYLVDASGVINFPVLGKLKVGGFSRSEVLQMLGDRIAKYIKNPIINLRIMNFKVSVQGEVTVPGTYPVSSDRITLIEALSMANDLTIYGRRDNILIIREVDGVKSYNRIDITKADFINSPFYYLTQNDVVYVEPSKTRINGAAVGANTGVIISITSLIITLVTLIITAKK